MMYEFLHFLAMLLGVALGCLAMLPIVYFITVNNVPMAFVSTVVLVVIMLIIFYFMEKD